MDIFIEKIKLTVIGILVNEANINTVGSLRLTANFTPGFCKYSLQDIGDETKKIKPSSGCRELGVYLLRLQALSAIDDKSKWNAAIIDVDAVKGVVISEIYRWESESGSLPKEYFGSGGNKLTWVWEQTFTERLEASNLKIVDSLVNQVPPAIKWSRIEILIQYVYSSSMCEIKHSVIFHAKGELTNSISVTRKLEWALLDYLLATGLLRNPDSKQLLAKIEVFHDRRLEIEIA